LCGPLLLKFVEFIKSDWGREEGADQRGRWWRMADGGRNGDVRAVARCRCAR
jgi:hypothetical protein